MIKSSGQKEGMILGDASNTSTLKYIFLGLAVGIYLVILTITLVWALYAGLVMLLVLVLCITIGRVAVNIKNKSRFDTFERYLNEKGFRASTRLLIKTTNWFASRRSVVGLWVDTDSRQAAFRLSSKDTEGPIYRFNDILGCDVECDSTDVLVPRGYAHGTTEQPLFTAYFLWIDVHTGQGTEITRINMYIMPRTSNSMNRFGYKKSQPAVNAVLNEVRGIMAGSK